MRKLIVAVIGVSMGLASSCSWRPTAATVDGKTISESQIATFAKLVRDDSNIAGLVQSVESTNGIGSATEVTDERADASIAHFYLTRSIYERVIHRELGRRGIEVTDEQRNAAWGQLGLDPATIDSIQPQFTPAGKAYITQLVNQLADQQAYVAVLSDEERQRVATQLFADADIDINPRYGRWDPESLRVVPLPEPAPTPSSTP